MRVLVKIIFFLGCISCMNGNDRGRESRVQLDTLQWLAGRWVMETPAGRLSEEWKKTSDSVYSGASFMVSGDDTLFSEKISLIRSGNELHYIPVVSDQNNGKPVVFRLASAQKGRWVFENPAHDFPQQIIYEHPHPDSLVATVAGIDKGKARQEVFRMKKQQE
jgi:hypothetical protein